MKQQLASRIILSKVGRLIAVYPYMETRLLKGLGLFLVGGRIKRRSGYFEVVGSIKNYHIDDNEFDDTLICTCHDFKNWNAPLVLGSFQRYCKHVIAVKIQQFSKNKINSIISEGE